MQILEKIGKLDIEKIDINRLKDYFNNITSEEIEVVLDLIKNLDFYKIRIENIDLNDDELKRYLIGNLAFRNEIKSNFKELIKIETSLLKTINTLPNDIKRKISLAYILKGIHILNLDKKEEIFKYKKITLKHFHDLGGFQTSLWGIKINYPVFDEILKNINEESFKKLESKNKILTKNEFLMIKYLFEK